MKRALAERAKQSGHPAGLVPPSSVPSASTDSPPLKVPRLEEPSAQADAAPTSNPVAVPPIAAPEAPPSSSSTVTTPRPSSSMKRQRSSQTSLASLPQEQESNEDEENQSAFYLKHQNRALASELKGLQYQLNLLEKERDVRRQQCRQAADALHALEKTWTEMEVALKLGTQSTTTSGSEPEPSTSMPSSIKSENGAVAPPRSTGTGDNVELIGVLFDSLAGLAKDQNSAVIKSESGAETEDYLNLSQFSSVVSKRATVLREWITKLLKQIPPDSSSQESSWREQLVSLEGQVVSLQSQLKDSERRLSELAVSKDEAVSSDRKVRRGLYRLAAGRMKLQEVLVAVELDDSGMAAMAAEEMAEAEGLESTQAAAVTTSAAIGEGDQEVDAAQVAQVKKELLNMEEIAKSRESQIGNLSQEREELLKRINELSLPKQSSSQSVALSAEDVKRSSLYTETATELVTARRQLEELRTKLKETMDKFATAKGDAEMATKSLEENLDKFQKRWSELAGTEGKDDDNGNSKADEGTLISMGDSAAQAKRIVELEHKLKQALENVRQADSVRASLAEAHQMNEILQAKLEEFKVKNAALVAGKSAARSTHDANSVGGKPSTPVSHASSSAPASSEKSDIKLHKDNRRLRKEVAAAMLSKEGAKEKQMRAEKERDALMKTNSRLMRQTTEKDDVNAKSLSTILHLKHLTEQLATEKELLEQETKSAEQLALAARLASNAKERLAEEVLKEKKTLEDRIKELEDEINKLRQERETADGALSQTKAEMTALEKSVSQMKDRCQELTTESTKREEEKRRLLESLAVAQRESNEASSRLVEMRKAQGGSSEFTSDELTELVNVYKGKLTCPVCNNREKNCILLRCRHIFCRHCVEVNVKNRSRKCPACGQRFDNKDVADVWF